MEYNPLVSVLMPVYNGEKYLKEAIDSILNQTYSNFELIICNDCSTDKSEEIILSYHDKRIRYIKNEKNLKLITTLNIGINLAKGKYIARMDADDISLPNRFVKQVRFLENHPRYALCGTWAYVIDSIGNKTGRIKEINSNELIKIALLYTCPLIHPSIMIKTEILQNFKYNNEALHCEDLELWLRISNSPYKMANLPQFLFKYRWHESNISIENEQFQLTQKRKVIQPYIESFINRNLSQNELNLHFYSFLIYKFRKQISGYTINLTEEKKWLQFLSNNNCQTKKFKQTNIDAFLWSRWIVCCFFEKKYCSIYLFKFLYSQFRLTYKTLKLLIYK